MTAQNQQDQITPKVRQQKKLPVAKEK